MTLNKAIGPVRRERYEQQDGIRLLRSLGAVIYESGTIARPGAKGDKYRPTCQTPGIPDVEAFLPPPRYATGVPWPAGQLRRVLKWECKSAIGRISEPQREYQRLCELSKVWHVVGDVTALLAFLVREGYMRADQLTAQRQALIERKEPA